MKINKKNNFYTDICSFLVHKKKVSKKTFENIFSNLRIDTTFKTTTFSRMNDLNTKLRNYSQKFFLNKMLICDFGVSSGQTTLELYNGLNKSQIKCIFGFDKQIYIKIFKFKKFIFLFSLNNKLLMVEFNKYCLRYRYFFFFKKFENFLIRFLRYFNVKYKLSDVLMPNLEKKKKIKFFEQDIFNIDKKFYNFFDVVRVSNLLNKSYFSELQLKKAILNIKKISKKNSIILVNRTDYNKKNFASFFIKKNNKFKLLEDVNGGCEIKEAILSS